MEQRLAGRSGGSRRVIRKKKRRQARKWWWTVVQCRLHSSFASEVASVSRVVQSSSVWFSLVELVAFLSMMKFPFGTGDFHEEFLVLDGNPGGKDLHSVFEVRVEEDITGAVDEGRRGGVQNVEAAAEGSFLSQWLVGIRVAQEHEDVPYAQLGCEGDAIVEEGQVPAGAIGGRVNP